MRVSSKQRLLFASLPLRDAGEVGDVGVRASCQGAAASCLSSTDPLHTNMHINMLVSVCACLYVGLYLCLFISCIPLFMSKVSTDLFIYILGCLLNLENFTLLL